MNNEHFANEETKYIIKTYNRYPIAFVKGKGAYLWDANGKKYLDFFSGLAVTNFGHSHPVINKAIKKQLGNIIHTTNLFQIPFQIKTAKLLGKLAFEGKTFFCNSGTEANEAAIKFARLRGNSIKEGKNVILSLFDSFHGRTTGSIKLTGQQKYQDGFEPLIPSVHYVTRNDINSLEKEFNENVCAIFLEGIQGESGVHSLKDDFVTRVRELCDKYDALLIFDEVQTGIGRTGKYFAYQHFNITPDVITIAKGISNGLPTGAMHVQEKYKDIFKPGHHASTFGGNHLCMAAASAVLGLLSDPQTIKHINKMSDILFSELNKIKKAFPDLITEIRGKGLMIAISLPDVAKEIHQKLLDNNIITNLIGTTTLRVLPPFVITEKEILVFTTTLIRVLQNK